MLPPPPGIDRFNLNMRLASSSRPLTSRHVIHLHDDSDNVDVQGHDPIMEYGARLRSVSHLAQTLWAVLILSCLHLKSSSTRHVGMDESCILRGTDDQEG